MNEKLNVECVPIHTLEYTMIHAAEDESDKERKNCRSKVLSS